MNWSICIENIADTRRGLRVAVVLSLLVLALGGGGSVAAATGAGHVRSAAGSTHPSLAEGRAFLTGAAVPDGTSADNGTGNVTFGGTVLEPGGDPAAGDAVTLVGANGTVATATTDAAGNFSVEVPENGSYALVYRENSTSATADGVPDVHATPVTVADGARPTIRLPAAHDLTVTVVDGDGDPVRNATVRITERNGTARGTMAARTNDEGIATSPGGGSGVEVNGTVTVRVEAPNESLVDAEPRTLTVAGDTSETVVLRPPDTEAPVARLSTSKTRANVSEPVTFDSSASTDDVGIANRTWRTDDGTRLTGGTTFTRAWGPGNHTVTLTVRDAAGNANSTSATVVVGDREPPEAALTANETSPAANTTVVRFDASNTTDNDELVAYRWDFDGDGTVDATTETPTVKHTYAAAGSVTASVTAVDAHDNVGVASTNLTVRPVPLRAAFETNGSSERRVQGQQVTFDAGESGPAERIEEYRWSFGDGTTTVTEGPVVRYAYADSGVYEATLTVVGAAGNATANRTVRIRNRPPAVSADWGPNPAAESRPVTLYGSASDPDGDALAVTWRQVGSGPAVNLTDRHTTAPSFVAPNVSENVTLEFEFTATDEHGASTSIPVRVDVAPVVESPVPAFRTVPRSPVAGERVTLNASAAAGRNASIEAYEWDFDGDGAVDFVTANESATHRYDAAGARNVTLRVTDEEGATDAVTRTVRVRRPAPTAVLSGPDEVVAGERVELTAEPPSGNASGYHYRWNQTAGPSVALGNRSTPTLAFDAPNVSDATDLAFRLTVSTDDGRSVTNVAAVRVHPSADGEAAAGDAPGGPGGAAGAPARPSGGGSGGPGGGATGGHPASGGGRGPGNAGTPGAAVTGVAGNGTGSGTLRVTQSRPRPRVVRSVVANLGRNESARISLPETGFGVGGAAFDSVTVVPTGDGPREFALRTESMADPPEGVDAPAGAARVLSYLHVHKEGITNGDIARSRFAFRVSASALRNGTDPESVDLYRRSGGTWTRLDAELVGKRGGDYRYEAEAPGFSVFAIGVDRPSVEVTKAALGSAEIRAGETLTVAATVKNADDVRREFGLRLTLGEEVLVDRTVAVPADATRRITLARAVNGTGTFAVAVNGVDAGRLDVRPAPAPETTAAEPGSTSPAPEFSDSTVLVLLLGVIAGAILWGYLLRSN